MFYSLIIVVLLIIIILLKKRKQAQLSYCCICEGVFKEDQIFNSEVLTFCKKDYLTYQKNDWEIIARTTASSTNSDDAMKIYELKQSLTSQGNICFIKTSYQERNGQIESQFELYGIKKGR